MPDDKTDVNNTSSNSSGGDNKDVNRASTSSTDDKTPDTVPYSRFKEVNDKASKVTGLEAEIAELKKKLEGLDKPSSTDDDDDTWDWSRWDTDDKPTHQPTTTTPDKPGIVSWESLNEEFREKLQGDQPLNALVDFYQRIRTHEKQQEREARKIKGFSELRDVAETIPDEAVRQVMQNEQMVRTILAKLKAGDKKSATTATTTPATTATTTPPAKTVEELREQIRQELAKEYNLKLDNMSSMAAESSTGNTANAGPQYELTPDQVKQFARMGHNMADPATVTKLTARLAKQAEADAFLGGL